MVFYAKKDIQNIEFLGKLTNCRKYWNVLYLVKHKKTGNYYLIPNGLYDRGYVLGKRCFGSWKKGIEIYFENEDEIQSYMNKYNKETSNAVQIFL